MKLFHLLNKYKWYIFSIVIIYIFFIILKYYNKNNKKNLQKNIINNDYFENKGKIITDNIIISTDSSKPNIHYTFN